MRNIHLKPHLNKIILNNIKLIAALSTLTVTKKTNHIKSRPTATVTTRYQIMSMNVYSLLEGLFGCLLCLTLPLTCDLLEISWSGTSAHAFLASHVTSALLHLIDEYL